MSKSFLSTFEVADDPNLRKIPDELPNTSVIEIRNMNNTGQSYNQSVWHHLHSFKKLPKKLPKLRRISFYHSIISNFKDLTTKMPKLECIDFSDCYIHNLIGIPENISVSFHNSAIDSFEGLDLPIPRQIEDQCIRLDNCTVRSLSGISRSTIQAILLNIASKDIKTPKNSTYMHEIKLDLPPKAIRLIRESIDPEIESRYSPKLNPSWPSKWTEKYARLPEGHPDRYVRYDIPDYYLHE